MTKTLIGTVVAVVGAIGYAFFTYKMLGTAQADPKVDEIIWQRALVIYNGVASVGFSCIGYLIGSTIQTVTLGGAKADAAQKTDTIKKALDKLTTPTQGQPNDLGGGPQSEAHRVQEVRQILIAGLS